jgi:hypothetical protein
VADAKNWRDLKTHNSRAELGGDEENWRDLKTQKIF